jgi:hypothetical protein
MGQSKRRISKPIIAVLAILGTVLICCCGLDYWWFDIAAYVRLKPYPKAVLMNTKRHHYSDSGTPSFNYILIEQYEVTDPSFDQVVTYYKQTMPNNDWILSCEGDPSHCSWCGHTTSPSPAYVLRWNSSDSFGTYACIGIESLTDRDASWRITHWTRHGRIF